MTKNLVIVESPAKAKTIERFLGKDYKVASSYGHIADLPSKELGIAVEKDFKPKYIVSEDKKEVVKKLKELTKKANMVWLASDEDREGEAIAWHLSETLKLAKDKTKRIVFHEITKSAIQKAIENPRTINHNLVDAQQARRVLDRLVGYQLSPVLWKKIKTGLSAGRVQSVSVRLIVEREREIKAFKPQSSYKVVAAFKNSAGKSFKAVLSNTFNEQQKAQQFLQSSIEASYKVSEIVTKPAKKSPAAPFTTSTLQQEASRKLYFPVSKTMRMAQRLYEAGFITYMRTDSVNLSAEAKQAIATEIKSAYGKNYSKPRNYNTKSKGAQEAHEAIRPTDITRHTIEGEYDAVRLYQLIWKRTLASQMSEAQLERTTAKINASTHNQDFIAKGEVIKFDGFLKVYLEGTDEEEQEQQGMLPALSVNEAIQAQNITATQRFTRPTARFTEAALVKKLEELGIGRPSTYAPTISTIQNRGYVEKGQIEGYERNYIQLILKDKQIAEKTLSEKIGSDKGKLVPTDIGMIVNDFLVKHFQEILDYHFTAKVEQDFDSIANGKAQWIKTIETFYQNFHPLVENVSQNAQRENGQRILGAHPTSGKEVSVRFGRFGPMVQIGKAEEEEKPKFASLLPTQNITSITLEEALELFSLPKILGDYQNQEVLVNTGRYGPYVKFGKSYISLKKGEDPTTVEMDRAIELIQQKQKADAPIANYKTYDVTKGKGRFGPYIKWNGMFISVSKKYDFDALSQSDIEGLIEEKLQKEKDKLIQHWEAENIKIEKARWGRSVIKQGKKKVELGKEIDPTTITLARAKKLLSTTKK